MDAFRSKTTPVRPWHGVLVLALILLGDYFTGPFIHSAVLFYLIPVGLAAWSTRSRWPSLAVAFAWPFLRLGIVALWGWPWPTRLTIEDTVVDVILSSGFAALIWQMRHQLQEIRTLKGLLPMCGFCKRIRTPEGWERVDTYILHNSEALITHTFCPDCGRLHYGHLSEGPPGP